MASNFLCSTRLSRNAIFSVAGLILLSACQSTPENKIPAWVTNPPKNSHIIYGVGSSTIGNDQAKAMQAATESARLEIAKNLNIVISANTQIEQTSKQSSGQFSQETNSQLFFKEAINNRVADIELSGINVVENYIDQPKKIVYVLAEFDKQQAIFALDEQIDLLDLDMENITINLNDKPLNKLKQAINAQKGFAKRQQLNNKLKQLGGNNSMTTAHQNELLSAIEQVLQQLSFSVATNQDTDIGLAQQLSQALTAQGLKITANADFQLAITSNWRNLKQNNTFYSFTDANITISADHKIIKNFVAKAKGVSSDEQLAKNKAIDKLADELIKAISSSFLQ